MSFTTALAKPFVKSYEWLSNKSTATVDNLKAKVSNALAYAPTWLRRTFVEATFQRLAREGYKASSVVYSCVTKYALAFPEPPLRIVDELTGNVVAKHPLLDVLRRPNKWMTQSRLLVHIIVYMVIGGDCYLYKLRARDGRVVGLRPLHAGVMTPVPTVDNYIDHYLYSIGGNAPIRIEPSDVIQIQWPAVDPERPELSYPPLLAVAREVDTAAEAARYTYALFKNDATPSTVISFPEGAGEDVDYEQVKNRAQERWGGDNRGSLAVIRGGASVFRLGMNLKELDSENALNVPEAHIASAFQIPPIIIGLNVGLKRSTFSNYGEARQAFTQDTLCPLWRLVAEAISIGMQDEFTGRPVRVEFDLTRVEALRENQQLLTDTANKLWLSGLMKRNESRAKVGLEALPAKDGDIYIYELDPALMTKPTLPAESGNASSSGAQDNSQDAEFEPVGANDGAEADPEEEDPTA